MSENDGLAMASETPKVSELLEEYQRAWQWDGESASRISACEDVRLTRWEGQSADGLKHQELMPEGQRALPYDRAPDTRVNLADTVIQGLVDRDYVSFWNARVKVAPTGVKRMTAAQAGELRQINSWMIHGCLKGKLVDSVEYASQVLRTFGWVVLHPMWRRQMAMRRRRLRFEDIVALAAQAPEDTLVAQAAQMIQDPTQEEAGAELLRQFVPTLKPARARRVIRELREDGMAEFPVPEEVSNGPDLGVLVPWQDFILPPEATYNPMQARVMFVRKFYAEADLRERAREEEWRESFVEEALTTKGMTMEYGSTSWASADQNQQLMEIAYAFTRSVDDDGVPGIYCTVFSPHVKTSDDEQVYGKHELVDLAHGEFPFVFLTTEVLTARALDARGVPDVLATAQLEMKQQRDATYVYSQLSVTPPLQKRGTQASKLPPELGPLGIVNNPSGTDWTWFPPPPGKPEVAFKLLEDVKREAMDYYGEARAETVPGQWQTRQQRQALRWLGGWSTVFWQLSVLAYQNLSPEELAGITGHEPLLDVDTVAKHRLMLWYDVRALNPEWVEFLLKTISEMVLPADAAGVVDRAKLVQFGLAYLDPTLAEELTSDQEGAAQAVFKGVRDEISAIMQGNEGMYVENDPTAKMKLQFSQQVVSSNPDYQAQLVEGSPAFSPRKRELMEKWLKNLGQSAAQQENKTIGRIGVKPERLP